MRTDQLMSKSQVDELHHMGICPDKEYISVEDVLDRIPSDLFICGVEVNRWKNSNYDIHFCCDCHLTIVLSENQTEVCYQEDVEDFIQRGGEVIMGTPKFASEHITDALFNLIEFLFGEELIY